MKKIMILVGLYIVLLCGCAKSKIENAPFLETWTVYSLNIGSEKDTLMAEVLEEGEFKKSDIYEFNRDGTITSKTNEFGIARFTWGYEDGKYIINAETSPAEIEHHGNKLTVKLGNVTLHLIKGKKNGQELLEDAGLYHVDELQIVNSQIEQLKNGYYAIEYEIKNNTSREVSFVGITIEEYDSNDTELESGYSYTHKATTFKIQPKATGKLSLIFPEEKGIKRIVSSKYKLKTSTNKNIEGNFSIPYTVYVD